MGIKIKGLKELEKTFDKLSENAKDLSENGLVVPADATDEEIQDFVMEKLFEDL